MPQITAILARKLGLATDLSDADVDALQRAIADVREVPARTVLIDDGARPDHVHVVLDGFAYRYKVLPGGERQILAWLVPGDFCDLHAAVLGQMDHTVSTVSASKIGRIPRVQVMRINQTSPALSLALWWASLVQEAILREWLVSLGRRHAESRAAHFFCELHARLAAVGLANGGALEFPLTQAELADTMGISPVHMNRTIQSLREKGLIDWKGKTLILEKLEQLQDLAEFDPNYLHLERRPTRLEDCRGSQPPPSRAVAANALQGPPTLG